MVALLSDYCTGPDEPVRIAVGLHLGTIQSMVTSLDAKGRCP